MLLHVALIYLAVINVVTSFMYGIDKWKAIKEYKCEIVYDYGIINDMALKKPEFKTFEETMQYFKSVKGVTNVEYDHIIRLTDPVKPRLEIK